jgi:phage tail sheath protein FI
MITGTPISGSKRYFSHWAPGVYLEEEFNQPRRSSFSTGVPVFIGLVKTATKERAMKPLMLSLWSHFKPHVGEFYQDCFLAYAVRGFFENGGKRCYVIVLEDQAAQTLLDAFEVAGVLHTVDLVCLPDPVKSRSASFERQQLVVNHCETLGDRFAILDSWLGDEKEGVSEQWSSINGNNGALYYPWIRVRGFDDHTLLVPPCGHVAGVYARTDESRGVHKAPANEVLEGVVDLEKPHGKQLTNADQDFLNPNRVNCLRSFPGRGIRVWGARTLGGHDTWTYVNVRRLFLTAVRWINWHMTDVVFEPNDARLWARIERDLNTYFLEQFRRGALKGGTPQEAYYVKCNAETNPPELRDLGQVVTEIGLAPANPYEFVVVRLIHGASGVSISGPIRPEQNL